VAVLESLVSPPPLLGPPEIYIGDYRKLSIRNATNQILSMDFSDSSNAEETHTKLFALMRIGTKAPDQTHVSARQLSRQKFRLRGQKAP
jgi:hypothetical protein